MPEWSNGAVSKTVVRLARTGGSNPSFSAKPYFDRLSNLSPFCRRQNRAFLFPNCRKFRFRKVWEQKRLLNSQRSEEFGLRLLSLSE